MICFLNFHDGFKILIGFPSATLERAEQGPYFKGNKTWAIKETGSVWMTFVPWTLELGF